MDAVLGLGLIVLGVVVYFIPGIVAHMRGHHQENAIVLLNLFLGWTFLGWVAALVWAAMAVRVDTMGAEPQQAVSKPIFPKLIAGLTTIGVVVIGGGYIGYNAMKQAQSKDDAVSDQRSAVEPPAPKADVPVATVAYLPIDSMVVNLADPDGDHVAQIGITFELRAKSDEARVKAVMPAIRSQTLELLSRKVTSELLTQEGKEQLVDEILRIAASQLHAPVVTNVLFSSFIVQ